jgi:hypothetical protein
MRKIVTAGLAAVTLGGAIAASAAPAEAQPYRGWGGYYGGYYHGGHHHNDVAGPALAAGVLGLAVGAALGSSAPHYAAYPAYSYGYAPAYPAYGYAPGYYGYSYGPAYCQTGRWAWDPYIGRRVWVRSAYPC